MIDSAHDYGKKYMIMLLRNRVRALRAVLSNMRYRNRPTREIFEDIYAQGKWGTDKENGQFYSGSGSVESATKHYVDLVRDYIEQNGIVSVVDLGCGDFRVGKQICEGSDISYTGIDIARPLISHLNSNFADQNVCFSCLDIIDDELPEADLYLVRQVFQHLSNDQISKIIQKLKGKTVLVTEHIPTTPAAYNKDKMPGPDIRLYRKSGVFLEHPPFSIKMHTLLEVPLPMSDVDSVLRTSLIQNQ
jgi:SAM-dependent methyltransferase